ncbi:putative transcriptional regulator [Mesotoga prima MesG1.Ag.4.2]|uniref:Putative transcriptional regulator n=2 Tax=Mesotoga prima TaxID=1184387 RepID=I2F776_9BACT|nr:MULTISPECIES: metalloregulator ArsR/SmtB family transcription factor [Mesotoga]AFK07779.1 putative transcriptional regulator [Mesotoga prima MesG1.Ag.4.2]PIJ63701.1 ArsR family transcriptional regulator [Mesotoga sp. H07.pep.5.3]RLL84413.1 ArsR family transcriptional regulator [Mesotoga sp. H07pep.5.4]HNQ71750.1 metalloregulator ArsR/SmtB family transcription factor [Mesotoga prima]
MSELCPSREIHVDVDKYRLIAKEVSGLSDLFKVIADETRTKIVFLLSETELCTCDLAEILRLSLPTISHHLKQLKSYRLVKSRREGKSVFYSLEDFHVVELIKLAREHFQELSEGD